MGSRDEMLVAIKTSCVPVLRASGFKGSFPNWYRSSDAFTCLVNFQFYSSGGSFCVNISYAGPDGENVYFKPETPAKKLTVSQTKDQARLGGQTTGDRWFTFGETNYGETRGPLQPPDRIVDVVNELFTTHAEPWWDSKKRQLQTGRTN